MLFPFISNAQLKVSSISDVGIGTTSPNTSIQSSPNRVLDLKASSIVSYIAHGGNTGQEASFASNGIGAYFDIAGQSTATNNFFVWRTSNTNGSFAVSERMRMSSAGLVGIGMAPNASYRLSINGSGLASGGTWAPSDQQFKTNIDSIPNALSLINQLKPRSFYFDTTNVYDLNFSNLKQYGLIAQDVEQLLPELVTSTTKPADTDTLGNVIHPAVTYKTLNYNAFIGIMLQGIKEQSSKIDSLSDGLLTEKTKTDSQDSIINSLQNQMNALASMINSCCEDHHDNGNHNGHHKADNNQTNVELNDAQTIVLEQNVPNPFAEQTTINYSLPDNTVKAQMLFYNAQGKLIQSTELTQKGKGTLNVFASDLSNGIYTYTLVVDGKIIETKKMVKQ